MIDLDASIAEVALSLPAAQVRAIAGALAEHQHPSLAARAAIGTAVPTSVARTACEPMLVAWKGVGCEGREVSAALLASATVAERLRAEQHVEIVWTGPATAAVPVRATAYVLKDLIDDAKDDLLLVSFAAYKVPFLLDPLLAASARGVAIRFILESAVEAPEALTVDAKDAFRSLVAVASFLTWPAARRPPLPSGTARLHAKCAVADRAAALVTSANLTGHGLLENMELGLLVRGGSLPPRIATHWDALVARGDLS